MKEQAKKIPIDFKKVLASIGRFLKKYLKIIIPVIIVAVVVLAVYKRATKPQETYTEETIKIRNVATYLTYTGNVEAVSNSTIIPKVNNKTVTAINVSIGQEVSKGDVLAELDNADLLRSIKKSETSLSNSELNNYYSLKDATKNYETYVSDLENNQNTTLINAQRKLETAQDAYEKLMMETTNNMNTTLISSDQKLADAKTKVERAEDSLNEAEAALRYAENHEDEKLSKSVEACEKEVKSAKQSLSDAKLSYDRLMHSYMLDYYSVNTKLQDAYDAFVKAEEDYELAQKEVAQKLQSYKDQLEKTTATANTTSAAADLDALYDQLEDYKIISPIDGVITALDINIGDSVTNSKTVVEVTNYSTMKVQIKIDEDDIKTLKNGTNMDVSVSSIGKTYKGTIANMSKKATVSNNIAYFTADVIFDGDEDIRSGLSAEVKFLKRGVENVVAVSMSALNYNEDNTAYVLVGSTSDPKKAEKRSVTLGMTNGNYIEVKEGLSEGEKVLVKQTKTSQALMQMQGNGNRNNQQGGMPGGMQGGMPAGNAPGGNGSRNNGSNGNSNRSSNGGGNFSK